MNTFHRVYELVILRIPHHLMRLENGFELISHRDAVNNDDISSDNPKNLDYMVTTQLDH